MNTIDKSQKTDRQALWNMIRWWYIMGGMNAQAKEIIKTFEKIEKEAAREGYMAGFRDASTKICI